MGLQSRRLAGGDRQGGAPGLSPQVSSIPTGHVCRWGGYQDCCPRGAPSSQRCLQVGRGGVAGVSPQGAPSPQDLCAGLVPVPVCTQDPCLRCALVLRPPPIRLEVQGKDRGFCFLFLPKQGLRRAGEVQLPPPPWEAVWYGGDCLIWESGSGVSLSSCHPALCTWATPCLSSLNANLKYVQR